MMEGKYEQGMRASYKAAVEDLAMGSRRSVLDARILLRVWMKVCCCCEFEKEVGVPVRRELVGMA